MTLAIILIIAAAVALVFIFTISVTRTLQFSRSLQSRRANSTSRSRGFPQPHQFCRDRLSAPAFTGPGVSPGTEGALASNRCLRANCGAKRSHPHSNWTTGSSKRRSESGGSWPPTRRQRSLIAPQCYLRSVPYLRSPCVARFERNRRCDSRRLPAIEHLCDAAGQTAKPGIARPNLLNDVIDASCGAQVLRFTSRPYIRAVSR